jgi:hypothetical protein
MHVYMYIVLQGSLVRQDMQKTVLKRQGSLAIVKSARKVPYGPMNLQKFAHFYVLSAHYIGQRLHESVQFVANSWAHMVLFSLI